MIPPTMDAASHIRWAYLRAEYARLGGRLGREGDPTLCSGVKRIPVLYTLPYWKVTLSSVTSMEVLGWGGLSWQFLQCWNFDCPVNACGKSAGSHAHGHAWHPNILCMGQL